MNILSKQVENRKRYQSLDVIPNFGNIIKDILDKINFPYKRDSWERSFRAEIRGKTARQYTGRKYMQKIVGKIENYITENNSNSPDSLKKLRYLAFSDIYWIIFLFEL